MLAGAVTLITLVGILPYIALQLKAVSVAFSVMTGASGSSPLAAAPVWWGDCTLYSALVLAGFTMVFGARHLDNTERNEGMVAAVAFESLVKLVAFLAVGVLVTFVLFGGPAELFAQVRAHPDMNALLRLEAVGAFPYAQWFGLTVLAMMSVVLLPAAATLFASFIGFDSIAQAGGEARHPSRDLPLAIFIAVGSHPYPGPRRP